MTNSQTLPRHRVVLPRHDPEEYAIKLEKALAARNAAESHVRFNLYVNNMPVDDLPPLTSGQLARIKNWAVNSKRLGRFGEGGLTTDLLEEIVREHQKALNKIDLIRALQDQAHDRVFARLSKSLHTFPKRVRAPELATVPVPRYDYPAARAQLQDVTMYMHSEAIVAMCHVQGECNGVLDLRLFVTDPKKPMTLKDFITLEQDAYKYAAQTLKRNWTENTRHGVMAAFSEHLDSGTWKDLNTADRRMYEGSRMKRLLKQMQYVMEQSLRQLTHESIDAYARMIADIASFQVEIVSTHCAKVTYAQQPPVAASADAPESRDAGAAKEPGAVPDPFFWLDLKVVDGMVNYSTPPHEFESEPLRLFEEGLEALADISKLDSLLIKQMYLGRDSTGLPVPLCLSTTSIDDETVKRKREAMGEHMCAAVAPLHAYIRLFDSYVDFLNLDVSEYLRTYEERHLSLAEDDREIKKLLEERARVGDLIPQEINLGLFMVRCGKIKVELERKYDQIIRKILCLVAQKASEVSKTLAVKFAAVHSTLQHDPQDIEGVVAMEELIADIPKQMADILTELQEMNAQFELLDKFAYQLSDDLCSDKWNAYAWPKKIDLRVAQVEEEMLAKRESFRSDQEREQDAFIADIERVGAVVSEFHAHTDINNLEVIAAQARNVSAQLAEYNAKAKQFNAREALYGKEQTDYQSLAQVTKAFEPYAQLWVGIDDWRRWQHEWKTGDFDKLEPEQMEKDIQDTWRNLFKASKVLAEYESISALALDVRAEIDEFKPMMPIITALRNPGLRERHWDRLSQELGITILPGETLNTLADVVAMDLRSHEDKVVKSCEAAGKEYAIESALDKMMNEWNPVDLEIMAYRETGSYVLKGADDIQQRLDDHIVMTQAMSFSPFKKAHEERLEAWSVKLNKMSEILEQWLNCQRNWMYLEPIFSSPDITKQLPSEAQKFKVE
jgi:dynein heavy chain